MSTWGLTQYQGTRDYQQDVAVCLSMDQALLVIVADGMGGHQNGRRAAEIVTKAFVGHLSSSKGEWPSRLRDSVSAASTALNHAFPDLGEAAPGTTLAAAVAEGRNVWHVSVGDSLIARITGAEFQRLNADHSMAPVLAAQVEQGLLAQDDLDAHPAKHQLRSAIVAGGSPAIVDCPALPTTFGPEDYLIVMSDGMLSLRLEDIKHSILASPSPQHAADDLIARLTALALPNQDNASIIVVFQQTTNSRLGWWLAGLATGAALLVGLAFFAAQSVGVNLI